MGSAVSMPILRILFGIRFSGNHLKTHEDAPHEFQSLSRTPSRPARPTRPGTAPVPLSPSPRPAGRSRSPSGTFYPNPRTPNCPRWVRTAPPISPQPSSASPSTCSTARRSSNSGSSPTPPPAGNASGETIGRSRSRATSCGRSRACSPRSAVRCAPGATCSCPSIICSGYTCPMA